MQHDFSFMLLAAAIFVYITTLQWEVTMPLHIELSLYLSTLSLFPPPIAITLEERCMQDMTHVHFYTLRPRR